MSHFPVIRALRDLGVVGTFKTLWKMRTIKFGSLVGRDVHGNEYYENKTDYANGQHRWVVYPGFRSFYDMDASIVPPEWHGWLHHATAEPPTMTTVGSVHRDAPLAIARGSSAPYERAEGGVVTPPTPNVTQMRARGYGLGNGLNTDVPSGSGSLPGAPERFYLQPGHPLHPDNAASREATRRGRVTFSLRDTPLTLAAKEAARHGLGLFLHEQQQQGGSDGATLPAASVAPSAATTYSAAVAAALSPEELAVISNPTSLGASGGVDELLQEATRAQAWIDAYKASRLKEAIAGVQAAVLRRDAALAKVALLSSAREKLARVNAEFEGRGMALAAEAIALTNAGGAQGNLTA